MKIKMMLKAVLEKATKVVVVGIGNEFRCDDIAGVLVVQELEKRLPKSSKSKIVPIIGGSAPENITGLIKKHKPSHVVLIDAADIGESPGSIKILGPSEVGSTLFSTHTLPLTLMVTYLKQELNCEVIVIGIQPERTEFGSTISVTVARSADELVKMLVQLE